jgi:hypothetical protein
MTRIGRGVGVGLPCTITVVDFSQAEIKAIEAAAPAARIPGFSAKVRNRAFIMKSSFDSLADNYQA